MSPITSEKTIDLVLPKNNEDLQNIYAFKAFNVQSISSPKLQYFNQGIMRKSVDKGKAVEKQRVNLTLSKSVISESKH